MNDLTANLVRRIREASTAADLHTLRNHDLAHLVGISDEERAQLGGMISKRFGELNAAAHKPAFPGGRW